VARRNGFAQIARVVGALLMLGAAANASAGQGGAIRAVGAVGAVDDACAALGALRLPDTMITSAATVAGPSFTPPGSRPLDGLPAFCRVVGLSRPAINFEVWMPLEGWAGRFQGVGNGGMAGTISYDAMATALGRGAATASSDTGHVTGGLFDASWAIGRPDLIEDFGHRGTHVMTVHAKTIVNAFYDRNIGHSYFVGCSKGGQQALMEAERYPEDYDGIVAGDPANDWTRFYAGGHAWIANATRRNPESWVPPHKIPLIADAVIRACDAIDGIRDGVLDDPRACRYDPAPLTCPDGRDAADCLTAPQVQAVRDIWAGARSAAGELIFPGIARGGEHGPGGWATWITGRSAGAGFHEQAADGFFKYFVFENPEWDLHTFDFERDVPVALEKVGRALDAADADLRTFRDRGGKLIVYHGWSDPDISPISSIDYHERVAAVVGEGRPREEALDAAREFFRLFMVPGMQHCSGGPGPNTFDMLTPLERWVEQGMAPTAVLASHATDGAVDRTRPLCVYPQVAVYTGSGSTDDAANFECRDPGR